MKRNTQTKQIVSLLVSFVLLVENTGCYSTTYIAATEVLPTEKYVVHAKKSSYSVDNAVISEGILSCKLDFSKNSGNNISKTHIYLKSDSGLSFRNDWLFVPAANILKIEQKVPDTQKNRALTAAGILLIGGLIVIGLTALLIGAIVKPLPPVPDPEEFCSDW